ncbi:MAG TPA: S41 family peptidase [Alphaproteobacteria bacterium]|jgi:carboxyl-terminal processing protease|nr:S41 family peptidase [Alphaproteobacteria bacterium]
MTRKFGLVALVAGVVLLTPYALFGEEGASDTYRQLNLFGEVFERVRADYVEEVTDGKLIETAINGMLTSLDPHSSYLNPDSFRDMQVQTKGEFGGLGIEVTLENGFVKVVSPIDDTPAAKAGIRPGDVITHLDGESVLGMTLQEAVDKMRGPVDTQIKLTIGRQGQEPFDVSLTRAVIKIQSVRSKVVDDVGYIRITSFNEQTESGLETAVAEIKSKEGDKLKGYVLDLRNNPGGLLDQAVAVSDSLLDKGEIVSTRGRKPEMAQRFNAKAGDLTDNMPVVVLINGGSASASEIVAGALQDHHRAIVVGTPSFGKGSVQTIIPLSNHGAMRLTTARYYTPSGHSIQGKGIEPDIEVPQAKIQPLETPQRRREADLKGALSNPEDNKTPQDKGPQDKGAPEGGKQPEKQPESKAPAPGAPQTGNQPAGTPAGGTAPGAQPAPAPANPAGEQIEMGGPDDYQLSRAIDLLRGLALMKQKAAN